MSVNNKTRIKVLIICGSGLVTSTIVASSIEDMLRKSPYNCELIQGGLKDMRNFEQASLILTMVTLPEDIDPGDVLVIDVSGLYSEKEERLQQEILEMLERISTIKKE